MTKDEREYPARPIAGVGVVVRKEDAVLLGMRAYLAFNDRAGAVRLYRQLERTLREELNTVPQAELRALYQSLL